MAASWCYALGFGVEARTSLGVSPVPFPQRWNGCQVSPMVRTEGKPMEVVRTQHPQVSPLLVSDVQLGSPGAASCGPAPLGRCPLASLFGVEPPVLRGSLQTPVPQERTRVC